MQTREESSKKEDNSFKMLRYRSRLRSKRSSVGRAMTKAEDTKKKPHGEKIPQQHTVIPSFFSKPSETAKLDREEGPAGLGSFPFKMPADGASNYPLSNNYADRCKTVCKICGDVLLLSVMRLHTRIKHAMQLSSYKKEHGALEIMKKIFHRCFICGKLVLWDSDKIGFHMKFQHRILEREYNAKYGINLDKSLEAPDNKEPLEVGLI